MVTTAAAPSATVLAEGIVRWLVSGQQTDGNLRDPVAGTDLPSGHYAVALFGAVCALAKDTRGAADAAALAVRYYLGLPETARGAHELNNLGLLRLYRCWRDSGAASELQPSLAAHLRRMPFASLTAPVTNNWHAMRMVCLAQRGRLFESEQDRRAACACLRRDVLPLQGADGLFADYPPAGRAGDRMTPLCYHAKFCAMLAMFLHEVDDAAAAAALGRGVVAMARLCAPDGESLYFGRSCNSVYGYASAVYAGLHALARDAVPAGDEGLVADAVARMSRFLSKMRRLDGSVRPYPSEFDGDRRGWDDYVDRLDYNAFAAFLLLQLPVTQPSLARQVESPRPAADFDAPQDGLLVREREGVFAAFSTRGQLHTGSYLFADARYAGMQPLTLQCDGRTLIPPPPHDAESPTDPGWVGFMPVIALGSETLAVRTYDEMRILDDSTYVAILGRGRPAALRAGLRRRMTAAAKNRGGRAGRALVRRAAPLLRRLALTPPAYTTLPVPRVQVRRAMILVPGLRCVYLVERLDGPFDGGWSTIRLAGRCTQSANGWRAQVDGLEARIWRARPSGDAEAREVFTSNGSAWVWRSPLAPGVAHVSAILFGPELALHAVADRTQVAVTARGDGVTHRIVVDLDAMRVDHG